MRIFGHTMVMSNVLDVQCGFHWSTVKMVLFLYLFLCNIFLYILFIIFLLIWIIISFNIKELYSNCNWYQYNSGNFWSVENLFAYIYWSGMKADRYFENFISHCTSQSQIEKPYELFRKHWCSGYIDLHHPL